MDSGPTEGAGGVCPFCSNGKWYETPNDLFNHLYFEH
jgi:hypothetical protein